MLISQRCSNLKKICNYLEKFLLLITTLTLLLMVAVSTLEIGKRTMMGSSFEWAQEFSLLLFGILVFCAGPIVFRRKRDAVVSYFRDKVLGERHIFILDMIINVLIIGFLIILFIFAIKLQFLQAKASAYYLPIQRNWFSFPVVIFAITTAVFTLENLLSDCRILCAGKE